MGGMMFEKVTEKPLEIPNAIEKLNLFRRFMRNTLRKSNILRALLVRFQ